jgi:DNA-directed RNA polymerase specialized sigma24 family protein
MPDNSDRSADRQLVDRCLSGETPAWEELRERHWGPLFSHLWQRLRTWANPDALVWEIADDVWFSLSYPDTHRLQAYDCSIASLNTFLRALADDRFRQARRKHRQRKAAANKPLDFDPPAPPNLDAETSDLMKRFAATLPPPYLAFYRYELLGEPPPEGWDRPAANNCRVLTHRIYLLCKDFYKLRGRGGKST